MSVIRTVGLHNRRSSGVSSVIASQGGFTLIEVLVSVLILLVGLLGVVGMQMLSLQANQGAYFRSQAIYMASEILDSMRANPTAAAAYAGAFPADAPADPGCQTGIAGCTPAQAAQHDLFLWSQHFTNISGVGRGTIPNATAVIAVNNDVYEVTVTWSEEQFDNTDATDGSDTRSLVDQTVVLTTVLTP